MQLSAKSDHANVKIIVALSLIHFTGDFYNAFIIPLLPLFVAKFSLTLAQAGLIAGLSRFLAFMVQPPVGYLADRYSTRIFALGGPLIVMVFISLTGVAPAFWILLFFVCLGSLGSSMFHPTAAGMIGPYSGRHFGFSMSVFTVGGTLSFAVGPLFISWYVTNFGLAAMPWAMAPGLMLMIYLYKTVPVPEVADFSEKGMVASIRATFGQVWGMETGASGLADHGHSCLCQPILPDVHAGIIRQSGIFINVHRHHGVVVHRRRLRQRAGGRPPLGSHRLQTRFLGVAPPDDAQYFFAAFPAGKLGVCRCVSNRFFHTGDSSAGGGAGPEIGAGRQNNGNQPDDRSGIRTRRTDDTGNRYVGGYILNPNGAGIHCCYPHADVDPDLLSAPRRPGLKVHSPSFHI